MASSDSRPLESLISDAKSAGEPRGFRAAIANDPTMSMIAEIKRRSPSKGTLRLDLNAASLAQCYLAGGATCLSVLTDEKFFTGSPDDLHAARRSVPIPILRKDFTVDERDVCDARIIGADCVLLIVAALEAHELRAFTELASEIGLDALVEVHDERELEMALDAGASLVGVNQRDLVTFEVDADRAVRVAQEIPDGVVSVAESGIYRAADVRRLGEAGFAAVLVGEALVTSTDPVAELMTLRTGS